MVSNPEPESQSASRISTGLLLQAHRIGRREPNGSRWLFRDVSLSVSAGEDVAVVGPTGSGKTLLLRSLVLLDPVDAGEILWRGEPVLASHVPTVRSRAIYLHQRVALLPGNVEENLRYPFTLKTHCGRTFNLARVVDLLKETGRNPGFLQRSVRELSGGERQIVAILRALQLDPAVILLDEPTSALDPDTTGAIELLVRRWRATSALRTTIWVSHDSEQVRRVASRVFFMQDGRLQENL